VNPARDIITAGTSDQKVPAHSPIPELFLAALSGGADPHGLGVISSDGIYAYLWANVLRIPKINLTPQHGKLPGFAQGQFLFRVLNPSIPAPNESETIRRLRADAAKGDSNAEVQLAWLYDKGLGGVLKDEREAARLFKLAANQGNAYAQASLGFFYMDGRGDLPNDQREAAHLFKLAADHGNADGQAGLGFFYEHPAPCRGGNQTLNYRREPCSRRLLKT
jgi:hypothetical protein